MPGGKFVFGLPGNPVSAFVCTLRLASRLLAVVFAAGVLPILAPATTLGLKLDSKKAPVEIIVVDHVERVPVEN